jgi:hypothetical protein
MYATVKKYTRSVSMISKRTSVVIPTAKTPGNFLYDFRMSHERFIYGM